MSTKWLEERRPPTKNKRPRPYIIECRWRTWGKKLELANVPWHELPWEDWKRYRAYRTAQERDAALEKLQRETRQVGGIYSKLREFRPADPE